MSNATLTGENKRALKTEAEASIAKLNSRLGARINRYKKLEQDQLDLIPQLQDMDLDVLDGDSEHLDQTLAKIRLFKQKAAELDTLANSPYFLKLNVTWTDSDTSETIHISKYADAKEKIYSWFSPIATLRYSGVGKSSYEKPDGSTRHSSIKRKDDFIIQNGDIVFMTHETEDTPRQVVFQKHMAERREFLLPEIVAELDKLQDQIIRTSPEGSFLISGPAGSGKTTLALHRVAYLVLTPEFREYFTPERIMVFVADDSAVKYFSGLLPELGIHGVKVTTFNDWATMIVNSRFRAKLTQRFRFLPESAAIEQLELTNPFTDLHPALALSEFRKFKQSILQKVTIREGHPKPVYPTLFELYENATLGMEEKVVTSFKQFLKFQKENKYLDEIDLIILLMSLEKRIETFVHIVVDEVQNWLPAQLRFLDTIISNKYNAVTFIGDIRQKTKAFSVADWSEVDANFNKDTERKVELLKVYRNTRPILEHLAELGFDVSVDENAREGKEVSVYSVKQEQLKDTVSKIIADHKHQHPNTQLGILAKYTDTLAGIGHLAFEDEDIHALTISEAQGLEFHTVVILEASSLHTTEDSYHQSVGYTSALEYSAQDRHLYYVAATRAREQLFLIN